MSTILSSKYYVLLEYCQGSLVKLNDILLGPSISYLKTDQHRHKLIFTFDVGYNKKRRDLNATVYVFYRTKK